MQTKYKKLDTKINKLTKMQTMTLLQKGLKYNLHTKRRDWLKNLTLEAVTALSHLPTADHVIYRS